MWIRDDDGLDTSCAFPRRRRNRRRERDGGFRAGVRNVRQGATALRLSALGAD